MLNKIVYRFSNVGTSLCLENLIFSMLVTSISDAIFLLFAENNEGVVISPFHDIPLFANQEKQVLNMVVEVPRWSNAKMEVRFTVLCIV